MRGTMNYFQKCILLSVMLFSHKTINGYILGSQNQLNAIAIQDDGKIVGAGFTVISSVQQFLVARYTTDGILDTTFGTQGTQTTAIGSFSTVYGVGLDSSSNIIVGGSSVENGIAYIALARYLPNGTLDTSFGLNGIVLSSIESGSNCNDLIVEADDKITITGLVYKDGEVWMLIARYNTDGTLDATFGVNGCTIIDLEDCAIGYALVKQPDSKYVIAGFAEGQILVTRVNANGSLDTSFGLNGATAITIGGSSSARGVDLQSDGKIIIGGYSQGACALARLNADGSLDTTFEDNGVSLKKFGISNAIFDLIVGSDDTITIAGLTDDVAISARYLADGTLDTSYGNAGFESVICGVIGNTNAIQLQSDEKVIVAGFTDNNGLVARLNIDGTFDSNFGTNGLVLDPTDYFPTCVANSTNTTNAYVFAYDTTDQPLATSSQFYDVTFNTNAQLFGWAHSTGTATFTCNRAGIYQITYTVAINKISGASVESTTFRLINNGTEISGTQVALEFSVNNQTITQSKTVIVLLQKDDQLKLQFASSDTSTGLVAGTGIGSVKPSASLTLMQLS